MRTHEYFERKYSEWNLLGFLNEYSTNPFDKCIDEYLKSLEIINSEEGKRQEKASLLLDRYRKEPRPDYYSARKWEKDRYSSKGLPIVFQNSTFSGTTLSGSISGGNFVNNGQKRGNEENQDKSDYVQMKTKRTKMEHYFPRITHETQNQPFENVDNCTELSGTTLFGDISDQDIGYTTPCPMKKNSTVELPGTTLFDDISDQDTGYTTPCPMKKNLTVELPRVTERQNKIHVDIDNPFLEESDFILSIDDIPQGLTFKDENSVDDFYMGDINVSSLFRYYQNQSLKLARDKGLFVETNVHEILSLSSILMLSPNSHSTLMIDSFGSPLLDQIHQELIPTQQVLDSESESKFRKAIKKANKNSRDDAIDWLSAELVNNRNLKKNFGSVILKGLETLPADKIRNEPNPDKHIVQWPNTALDESKLRKFEGRTKQPDFVVSVIHQLQTVADTVIGEVSPPAQKANVYKNCNDLIRLGVFMKDCVDFAIDRGAEINVIGFQCVDHTVDFYATNLVNGMYVMVHIGQTTVPVSLKEMLSFVDDIEIFLVYHQKTQNLNGIPLPHQNSTSLSAERETATEAVHSE
ncbi:C2H2-type zinc finger transcription factor [Rhizophagus irregularis DAOM 181602=DAOM 197198]|nr:C2H2-type zinc finger transcription factor [Rhizophagus irregularis DAOM 181602=DAOM 197198]